MMHVASLMPFQPPADAAPAFLRELVDEARRNPVVHSPWNRKLRYSRLVGSPLQSWVVDKDFDIDYHVRRSALASPGDERELGVLVSRLHGTPLDFHRPPWEAHFIEGLAKGRIALYVKVHHALVDGYTSMRLLQTSFSSDPKDRETPMFFTPRPGEGSKPKRVVEEPSPSLDTLLAAVRDQVGAAKSVGRALMSVVQQVRNKDRSLALPL